MVFIRYKTRKPRNPTSNFLIARWRSSGDIVRITVALDATLAGRPASALPGPRQTITVLEKEFGTKFSAPTTLAKIEAEFAQLGNGARGIVFGQKVSGGAGHVVNVVNQRGTVRFLDAQSGTVANFDKLMNFRFLRTN